MKNRTHNVEIDFEKKYHERYVRWQDKTREQFSFFNNLLLTLSVGFISFGYDNLMDTKIFLVFAIHNLIQQYLFFHLFQLYYRF